MQSWTSYVSILLSRLQRNVVDIKLQRRVKTASRHESCEYISEWSSPKSEGTQVGQYN